MAKTKEKLEIKASREKPSKLAGRPASKLSSSNSIMKRIIH
jgi:hypothetical protein